MPTTEHSFTVPTPPSQTVEIARRLFTERGWDIQQLSDGKVGANVPFKTKRASVLLLIRAERDGSAVQMDGKVSGWGPVLRRMLQEKLDAFQESLIYESGRQASLEHNPD